MKDKLVKVKMINSKELSETERISLGIEKDYVGLVAVETRLIRNISMLEVNEIAELYYEDIEKACDLYEQRLLETIEKVQNA